MSCTDAQCGIVPLRKILYIQYTNPAGYPPLEHSSRILANQGWKVLFLGTGAFGANALRFPEHPNITVRQLAFCPAGWKQKLHYLWFCLWVTGWTLRWRPNWIYASDTLVCPLAWLLSYLPGVKLIYHEHDSPAPIPTSLFSRLNLWTRKKLAQRTKLCVLPNEQRMKHFALQTGVGQKVVCVWNGPADDEVSASRRAPHGNSLWVFYHGSIVPSRLPLTILDALATLPDVVKLRVVGYETVGHKNYVEQLKKKASQLGISQRVEFLGTPPTREELLEPCRKSDIGVALMPKKSSDFNEQTMAGASNKPFDYLACGLALLVSDLPDWKKTYVEPGYGLTCNPEDPKSIAQALQWFLEHPIEMREMGEQGRQRILNEWNYEKQFLPMLNQLNLGKNDS